MLSGTSPDGRLVEIVELADHPWFVGTQAHPEFQSKPNKAHPLFAAFIAAALKIDPLEIRLKNGYDEGDKFVTEETLRSVGLKECLHEVANSIGWEPKKEFNTSQVWGANGDSVRRGKGLACMIKATITPSIWTAPRRRWRR